VTDTDTLDLALQASDCDRATVRHKPQLLLNNGFSYISGELADWLEDRPMSTSGAATPPCNSEKDQTKNHRNAALASPQTRLIIKPTR
jgi:hypothetical protein